MHEKSLTVCPRYYYYLNWLDCERLRAVSREHADEGIEDDLGLEFVCGCALDEHILGVKSDLGVVAIDNWRQREHDAPTVGNDRVHRLVLAEKVNKRYHSGERIYMYTRYQFVVHYEYNLMITSRFMYHPNARMLPFESNI